MYAGGFTNQFKSVEVVTAMSAAAANFSLALGSLALGSLALGSCPVACPLPL
jgi:hypothetical protein